MSRKGNKFFPYYLHLQIKGLITVVEGYQKNVVNGLLILPLFDSFWPECAHQIESHQINVLEEFAKEFVLRNTKGKNMFIILKKNKAFYIGLNQKFVWIVSSTERTWLVKVEVINFHIHARRSTGWRGQDQMSVLVLPGIFSCRRPCILCLSSWMWIGCVRL